MSIEFQTRSATLAAITSRGVRERLRSTCLPGFAGFSIDHLEVVPGAAFVEALAASVAVHVPVDVYIVDDAALMAAPNATPIGASTPAGRIGLSFLVGVELKPLTTVKGVPTRPALLTLAPGPIDFGQLAGVPGLGTPQASQQLQSQLPTLQLDLTPALTAFGLPAPTSADIVLVDEVVAVRFNATDAPRAQLFAGQDWGLFVSGPTVEAMLVDRIGAPLKRAVPEVRVSAHYDAADGTPRVVVEAELTVHNSTFDLDARLVIDVGIALTLIPRPVPTLRLAVDWSFHVFADLVPGFLEAALEDFAEGIASDLIDPTMFGGTPTGERSFVIDLPLPSLALPGVQLGMDSLAGSAEGMTLGGSARIAESRDSQFTITVHKLAAPLRIQLCSQLARTGSGARSPEPPTIYNTKSFAQLDIDGCGALCAVQQLTPAKPLQQYLALPTPGVVLESATLRYAIPYAVAMNLGQPLTLIVRTPRGVRLIDFGVAPSVEVDKDGVLLGRTRDYYVKDCINVVPGSGAGAGWGHMTVDSFKSRPLEEPDWSSYLQQAGGLIVQLATVDGLDAGELVRFRSATHTIDVSADARGRAVVPVMLPLAASLGAAQLVRANGRSLAGHVATDSAVFERQLTLPGVLGSSIAGTRSGALSLTTRSRRSTLLHSVSALGVTSRRVASGQEVELNPQPLPPVDDAGLAALNPQPLPPVDSPELTRAWGERVGLIGLAQVFAVPGHASRSAAVAVLSDGSKLMLDLHPGGAVRVAGTFAGPIGALESVGRWAVANVGRDVAVFSLSVPEPVASCGACSASEGVTRPADHEDAGPPCKTHGERHSR